MSQVHRPNVQIPQFTNCARHVQSRSLFKNSAELFQSLLALAAAFNNLEVRSRKREEMW
jgi:hypothetical protein